MELTLVVGYQSQDNHDTDLPTIEVGEVTGHKAIGFAGFILKAFRCIVAKGQANSVGDGFHGNRNHQKQRLPRQTLLYTCRGMRAIYIGIQIQAPCLFILFEQYPQSGTVVSS
jgi:hypothetical protein